MDYVGYRFNVDPPEGQDKLCADLRALVCETLNLCAAVGCACVTGTGDLLCLEHDSGGSLPLLHSQGPTWSVVVTRLRRSVKLDIYLDGPPVTRELGELYERIARLGWTMFRNGTSGAYSL